MVLAFLKEAFIHGCSITNFPGPPEYETMKNGKIFYLKLDLIGQHYMKEYNDHSSQQFEKFCKDIKEEVNIHSALDQIKVFVEKILANDTI